MPRGDGRLTHELDPQQPGPQDACGVFGVWAPGEEVAKLTYFGLYALQHRGQEAAGIAVSDGSSVVVYKDLGLVAQVFDESTLASLRGHIAIGHARYSTTGASNWENAQPTLRATTPRGTSGDDGPAATTIALAHNGNLVNTAELARRVAELGVGDATTTSDTALVTALLAARPDLSVEAAALEVLPTLRGAFSFVFMDEDTLYAARDPQGVRPLVLGRLERGWVVASETAALDMVGASVVREIEPGELLAIDEHGLRSSRFAAPEPKGCLFEYVYLARPDSTISGRNIYAGRVAIGRALAREHPVEADLVIPVPESGTPAAIGYAEESGIPYGAGLVKNAYVGRTFIQPSQTIRQLGIRLKLNPLRDNVRGKRIVVVDDSIVRGNTQRAIIRMLREAGAVEVHVRISSPPVKWPCFYGIDFATKAELLANGLDTDGIRRSIGADSLGYVSLPGLIAATEQPKTRLCRACFDGEYPIDLPADNVIGKHVLEGLAKTAANTGGHASKRRGSDSSHAGENSRRTGTGESAGGNERVATSPGGADALLRP
ncbi:amidophosphoribosyltransferase [Planosporangium flavigriseum]|uniref:Amidophosphoribosyltransferase n=1 Tax=Planosporangium flavigriseum TaxID=373681 RepID=A0A8J3PPR6_9ACTN|nr:amidophosphoribosyltransferase [Planosporangium flavigriseum]NJC67063.1 amidophosphoribosyltransferase [Planosporangium flavigriseum]GIG76188.1 amidophosphoribosyltransferase [Planosporangium flavigriseum]